MTHETKISSGALATMKTAQERPIFPIPIVATHGANVGFLESVKCCSGGNFTCGLLYFWLFFACLTSDFHSLLDAHSPVII